MRICFDKGRKIAAALCLLLLAPAAQAAVIDGGEAGTVLRAQPDEGAAALGRFYSGTEVEILGDAGGGWTQVAIGAGYAGVSGYLPAASLADHAAGWGRMMCVCSPYGTQSVVLRDRPSDSYSALAMLEVGTQVCVIGTADAYCYVCLDDGSVGCLAAEELE